MKRKLLYLTAAILHSVFSMNAQITVWDFGNSTSSVNDAPAVAAWPATASGIGTIGADTNKVINSLGLYSNSPASSTDILNFGAIATSVVTFDGGYTTTKRFQSGGAGYSGGTFAALPTQRYLYFNVDGACTVDIWFKGGSTDQGSAPNDRYVYVSDGAAKLGEALSTLGANGKATVSLPAAGKYYVYGNSGIYLYKIQVSGANVTTPSLGIEDFKADAASNVYSNGKLVFVSNVKSDTQVDVYAISGVLVKSFKTGSDTSFDLNTGIYIVKSKSAEGQKTAKVLVN